MKKGLLFVVSIVVLLGTTAGVVKSPAYGAPWPPELVSPGNGATASTNPPTLCARSAGDPDNDPVRIRFEAWGGGEADHGSPWISVDGSGNACWTDSSPWTAETHSWQARAIDSNGEQSGASPDWKVNIPAPVQPTNEPPATCRVDSLVVNPPPGQIVGTTVTISASGSCTKGVDHITFQVEGMSLGTTNGSSGSVTWHTGGLAASDYTITVTVYDGQGASKSATETYRLDVNNPQPTTAPPSSVASHFSTGNIIQIGYDVYVIVNGQRRLVPNPDTLDALGITRSWINNKGFSDAKLNTIPRGSDIPDVNRDPSGFQAFKNTYFPNTSPITPATQVPSGNSGGNTTTGLSIWVTQATVRPGYAVTVYWKNFSTSGSDWISMHPVSTSDSSYLAWQYVQGSTGSLTFDAPSQHGSYEFRLFANGTKVATSNPFTVTSETTQQIPQGQPGQGNQPQICEVTPVARLNPGFRFEHWFVLEIPKTVHEPYEIYFLGNLVPNNDTGVRHDGYIGETDTTFMLGISTKYALKHPLKILIDANWTIKYPC